MSKGNKCPIESSSSSDKNFASYQYRQQQQSQRCDHHKPVKENPLSHICKYLDVHDARKSSKENVELALEVEINESLKHVLASPAKNSSDALLDVTIIRPSDSDTTHETTVALNKDEVRDFISLVEQHHRHQNEPNREKTQEGRSNYEEYAIKEGAQRHRKADKTDQDKDGQICENPKQIYATVNNTFDKLKHNLPCQNKNRENEKSGTPCMCQHCGIVGVLVQSQKGPIASFPPLNESTAQRPNRPQRREIKHRRVADLTRKRSIDQLQLLREINSRIKNLEKRITIQEETAVPKEYLKHILHKVLTHYSMKNAQATDPKLRNNSTQYSSKNLGESPVTDKRRKDETTSRKYYQVHTMLDDHQNWLDSSGNQKNLSDNATQQEELTREHLYWLWGEEVVKPGCDLKTKILNLLEDRLRVASKDPCESRRNDYSKLENGRQYFNIPEKPPVEAERKGGIKVERDEKTIILNHVDETPTVKNNNYLYHQTNQLPTRDVCRDEEPVSTRQMCDTLLPSKVNKFSTLRQISPRTAYPFDVTKTLDDSTFRKNIEANKLKNKQKPTPVLEEKYYNTYASHSVTTESQASMNYIIQKLKNNAKILESGLPREKEDQVNRVFNLPNAKEVPGNIIKENINRCGFRTRPNTVSPGGAVDVKYISPKVRQWSDDSSTSEDRLMRQRANELLDKDPVTLEKKESLIYKLDFLKNLAKNKSIDQSRVLNKIWNQAKNTAKSKKDAVYIKIPFKNINPCDARDNLIEMHLTLEELETVVKSARNSSGLSLKVQSFKSSSEMDLGQRRHEEMRKANRELLKRRQLSARANRHRNRNIAA